MDAVARTAQRSGSDGHGGSLRRQRVLIIGGGFAGLYAARALARGAVDVTLIDRTNHHLFQPLLYQVATAVLAPSDITSPLRWLLRRQRNTVVLMAEARRIDVERRVVIADDDEREIPYDYLIVATGARHAYFGHDEWETRAPGLKSIEDAIDIRDRFLRAFEEAEKSDDPAEQAALMTFVVVGGGPTGVELAGMLPSIACRALVDEFRGIDTRRTRVILLEGSARVLSGFPEQLSASARDDLTQIGVEVRTNALVTRVENDAVYLGHERIATRTVFWAAGNTASPLGRWLGAPLDSAGRVLVSPDLSVPGHPEIFVAGDLAALKGENGDLVPWVSPAAMQQGRCAARNILRAIRRDEREPFRYRDKGSLATIGRHKAVADFGRFQITGRIAWWLWLFVHIMYLAGFRNRLSVLLEWGYSYFTYQRGVRLITPNDGIGREGRAGRPSAGNTVARTAERDGEYSDRESPLRTTH